MSSRQGLILPEQKKLFRNFRKVLQVNVFHFRKTKVEKTGYSEPKWVTVSKIQFSLLILGKRYPHPK